MSLPGIGELYAAWAEAFRRQDLEAILDLLTPDYVLWAPGALLSMTASARSAAPG